MEMAPDMKLSTNEGKHAKALVNIAPADDLATRGATAH